MYKIVAVICLFLCIVSSCRNSDAPQSVAVESHKTEKPLIIGLMPERNIFDQMERFQPLADYISENIGRRVELTILPRYGNVIENFTSKEMDAAFFGSFVYTLAHAKLGVEVLARPESIDGTSTYYGVMFVRRDSNIRTAADMKGKSFVFVDKATTAGYILPLAYFRMNGIDNYRRYLKETYFAGTHEDAIYDVLNGKADVGAAKNTVYLRLQSSDSRVRNELILLGRSSDVPENGFAVRIGLNPALKDKLRETLLNMHYFPRGERILRDFGARRFIKTEDADYSGVYDFVQKVGINLATYDYLND